MPTARRSKKAVTYRLPPQLIDRIKALAKDRHWTDTTAVELLLDEGLTRAGYPAQPEERHAE